MKSINIFQLLAGISIACYMNVYATNNLSQDSTKETTTQMNTSETQNKTSGEQWLAENKKVAGVVTLPSGLQYKIVKEGQGDLPTKNDVVTVHYSGKLINGTEFDSSYKRNEPATFPVSGVIPGWTEALQLMKKGSVWELYIPANLAYGTRGAPPVIGPNEVLIFKVELLDIKK